jgi:hypothetical protein
MGIEAFTNWGDARKPPERNTVVMKSTDTIVRELTQPSPLEKMSEGAQRILERILRANNRGRKVVVAGETKAITARIHLIELIFAHVR